MTDEEAGRLEKGIFLKEGKTAPCKIEIEKRNPRETTLYAVLHEGKKRQIRRIFEKIGHRVAELERLDYGPLSLGDLRPGEKRELTPREIKALEAVFCCPKCLPTGIIISTG